MTYLSIRLKGFLTKKRGNGFTRWRQLPVVWGRALKSEATAANPLSTWELPAGKPGVLFFPLTIIGAQRSSSRARAILIRIPMIRGPEGWIRCLFFDGRLRKRTL